MKNLYLFLILVFALNKVNANPTFLVADNYPITQRGTLWAGPFANWGYTGYIIPISSLDFPILTYDVLVIASADSVMTPLRINNVLQFLYAGKPVYIQCEKDSTNSMNQAFVQLVTALGGSFSWGSTTTGHFGPLPVQGTFATTPLNVPAIDTFYDGCTGSGSNTVFPFLSYGGNDYGFCFCPPNPAWGKIIMTTDQGWVYPYTANGGGLVENIDYHLINPTYCGPLVNVLTLTPSHTNVSCHGGNDGTATVAASGGTAPYTYLWLPGNQTTATITGLAAGSYTCRVIDAAPDTVTDTIVVTEPLALTATTSQTNVNCNGGNDGTATVSVSGGTPGYTYAWAPAGGNNATATGLAPGNYTCTITDANNCVLTETFTITQPGMLTATVSQVNILCNGNTTGSATVNVSGGTPSYTYAWLPTGGNNATATGLAAGNYTCTITDANGCTLQENFTLVQPTAMAATTTQSDIACYGDATGSASVSVSGGTPGYTYQWMPSGGNTASATGLSAGNYTCTITDANQCVLVQNVNITQPASALAASTTHTDVSCTGAGNGSATVTVSGGTPAYTYQWAPGGGNAATANNLNAGTYTCTITDNNNCALADTVVINDAVSLVALDSQVNVSCYGDSNGSAIVSVSGGTPPYNYQWIPFGGNTGTANGLPAGSYTCTISDANNCGLSSTVLITEPALLAAVASATDILCRNATGIIIVNVSGGTAPYTYSWAPVNSTGNIAAALDAGTYTCTVTDAGNCSDTVTATVNNLSNPLNADFSYEPVNPQPGENISFHNLSSASAGNYYWSFGDGSVSTEADPVIAYNDSGLYHVCLAVSDANNCADTMCRDIAYSVERSVAVPSAFSPNGDGVNDILYIRGYRLRTVRLRIYDRWGVLVFETDNKAIGWDGTYKGQPQGNAAYAYTLEATFTDGTYKQLNGSITLLR
jgi:gliding motility-associated-like protein